MKEITKLLKSRIKYLDNELTEVERNKLKGSPACRKFVEIVWNDGVRDYGYLFTLPDMDDNDHDYFLHIPHPDNSSGIGDAPPVWIYLKEFLTFENLEKITVKQSAIIEF